MKSNLAAGVLTALVYAQVILCFAGVATVLLRNRADAQQHITIDSRSTRRHDPPVAAFIAEPIFSSQYGARNSQPPSNQSGQPAGGSNR